jgi:hypothetical protein
VLRVPVRLTARFRVTLAARRGQQNVVSRNLIPARLVQILTNVHRVGVVGAVPFDCNRPVVGGPENFDTGRTGTGRPSAEPGEQIDCCGHRYSDELKLCFNHAISGTGLTLKGFAAAALTFTVKALLCSVIFVFTLLVVIKYSSPLSSSEAASWVQAIGSVGAIWVAIFVYRKQVLRDLHKRNKELEDWHQHTFDLAYETACMYEVAADNFYDLRSFRANHCGRLLSLLKLQVNALSSVSVKDLKTSLLLIFHLEVLAGLASLCDRLEVVRSRDLPAEELTVMMIDISSDAWWVKEMWVAYKRQWEGTGS